MKDLKDRSYILKEGRSIQTEFGGDTLTNDNLTDKAAEKLLKANPSLAKHFEVLPEGLFDDSSKVKALTAPEIKSLVDGLSPEEKAAFLTSVNENITAKQPLVIKIEDTDRELTLKQLEKIAKENTPAQ